MSTTILPRRTWNIAHYERHLTTVALELRNWIDRGANKTAGTLADDAVILIRGLRRDHDAMIAEPMIRRILDDVCLSEADIDQYAARYGRGS